MITLPYYQTHADVEEKQQERLGITPTLLRLSVGLEDPADLIVDLQQALGKVRKGAPILIKNSDKFNYAIDRDRNGSYDEIILTKD